MYDIICIPTSLQVPIQWEEVDVTPILKNGKTAIPDAAIQSVRKNTVALKGPLATPSAQLALLCICVELLISIV